MVTPLPRKHRGIRIAASGLLKLGWSPRSRIIVLDNPSAIGV
jgi:hypothetical protein